jgi:hypothetical protein
VNILRYVTLRGFLNLKSRPFPEDFASAPPLHLPPGLA